MNDFPDMRLNPLLPSTDQLAAYYQPIVALDTRLIVGYEALGRQVDGEKISSLGPFFANPLISTDDHISVDRQLRERAIAKLATLEAPPSLFLNLKPSWIYRQYKETGELHTLQLLDRYGLDPSKICIEITEEEFGGSVAELGEIIQLYRDYGCQIAIDDVGAGFSNFDRIAQIQPNLLKVDIHLLKRSRSHSGYLGVLRSFSTLAEQIGASLLMEGVETREDLLRAIQIGSRYVQGYLFAPAEREFRAAGDFARLIGEALDDHRLALQTAERFWQQRSRMLVESQRETGIGEMLAKAEANGALGETDGWDAELADAIIAQWLPWLDEGCQRVFLCRENGVQLSSNHVRDGGGSWRQETKYIGSDWSWRPYFIPHLVHAERSETKVSTKYADLDTHAWIRTVSIPVGRALVLFLDIADPER